MNDMTDFDTRKARASGWFRQLRDDIVAAFEGQETANDSDARFEVTETKRASDDGTSFGPGCS